MTELRELRVHVPASVVLALHRHKLLAGAPIHETVTLALQRYLEARDIRRPADDHALARSQFVGRP